MKKKFLNISVLTILMLTDFAAFAQTGPGDDDDNGGLEGNDPNPVPINGKLLWLGLIGIAFAFYTYKNYKRAKA
ncbi:MAG: hypothetical protein EOO51_15320 [Flavobacterium sp.]|nr:MAG: hypothetical protein EOO51_15320 [Flavobacterium sp.]